MGTQGPPSQTLERTLDVFGRLDSPGTPLTTDEIANELECDRETALPMLQSLVDGGALRTKAVGLDGRVWWQPADQSHRTESSSNSAHAQFRELVRAVTDYAIFVLDSDGYIQTWNDGARQIKGYERDEILGEHVSTFYTDEEREAGRPERNLNNAATQGRIEDEGKRVRKDGSTFWANVTITSLRDDEGNLDGFIKITRDMTDRHEYEKQLRHEKERFETLVREVKDYAIFLLDPDGIVQTWNEGAKQLKGYEKDEIVGRHFSAFYTESDREAGRPERNLHKAATQGRVEDEGKRVRKDGSTFWANVTITALYDDGELRGFAKVTRDTTEQHEYEQAIENERERLEFMNRIVRHNVLNGLNLVNARTQILQDAVDDAEAREHLDTIQHRVLDLSSLINTMRKFMDAIVSNVDHDVEPTPVREALTEKLALVDESFPEAVFEAHDLPDESTHVVADELVGEVFENVLSNAVIHNDKETPRVEVWASETERDVVVDAESGERRLGGSTDTVTGDVEVRTKPAVTIHVADNGPGIADEQRDAILQKGVSGMGTPGNGLGLYLVKEMMNVYGGFVDVRDAASAEGVQHPSDAAAEGVVFDLVFLRAEPTEGDA